MGVVTTYFGFDVSARSDFPVTSTLSTDPLVVSLYRLFDLVSDTVYLNELYFVRFVSFSLNNT